LLLTPGQAHDLAGADALLPHMAANLPISDRAFDADRRVLDCGWQSRRNPASTKPFDTPRIRSRTLQRAPPDRKFLLHTQAVPRDRNPLRQTSRNFLAAIHLAAATIGSIDDRP
jgi:hypothetical protein